MTHQFLQIIRKTINHNAHFYSNKSSGTSITNRVIVYYYKNTPIKTRIQDAINFLNKKKSKPLIKMFFGQTIFLILKFIKF